MRNVWGFSVLYTSPDSTTMSVDSAPACLGKNMKKRQPMITAVITSAIVIFRVVCRGWRRSSEYGIKATSSVVFSLTPEPLHTGHVTRGLSFFRNQELDGACVTPLPDEVLGGGVEVRIL